MTQTKSKLTSSIINKRIIGFSGSREISYDHQTQRSSLVKHIMLNGPYGTALHGCADGWDRYFHWLVLPIAKKIFGYPCNFEQSNWAQEDGNFASIEPISDPLHRNRLIASKSTVLYACPNTMEEIERSGTWATIRYRRQYGKRLVIVYPDGSVAEENQ